MATRLTQQCHRIYQNCASRLGNKLRQFLRFIAYWKQGFVDLLRGNDLGEVPQRVLATAITVAVLRRNSFRSVDERVSSAAGRASNDNDVSEIALHAIRKRLFVIQQHRQQPRLERRNWHCRLDWRDGLNFSLVGRRGLRLLEEREGASARPLWGVAA